MNYTDKCLISIMAQKATEEKNVNIYCQFGELNGLNTCFLACGKKQVFTIKYDEAKKFIKSL